MKPSRLHSTLIFSAALMAASTTGFAQFANPLATASLPKVPPSASAATASASGALSAIPADALSSLTAAATTALANPALKALQQKVLDATSGLGAALTSLINANPTIKAIVAKTPAVYSYLLSTLNNLSPAAAASAAENKLLSGLPAPEAAAVQAFAQTLPANPAIQAAQKSVAAAFKPFSDLLSSTVSQNPAIKTLVAQYPSALTSVAASLGTAAPTPAAAAASAAKALPASLPANLPAGIPKL